MKNKRSWSFAYRLPTPAPSDSCSVDPKALEHDLKNQLQQPDIDPVAQLFELVRVYRANGSHDKALECLCRIKDAAASLESKALCQLTVGQIMEQTGDFAAAILAYRQALAMEPARDEVWYLIHNNLGYCYNRFGLHIEAERLCRIATGINPKRSNAFKNLGIALEGRGEYREAAQCFIEATRKSANDPRATELLGRLIDRHPELLPEFAKSLDLCQRSVRHVAEAIQRAREGIAIKVLLGCRKLALQETVFLALSVATQARRVELIPSGGWQDLVHKACNETYDLIIVVPEDLGSEVDRPDPGCFGAEAIKQITSLNPANLIVLIGQLELYPASIDPDLCAADAVLGLPTTPDTLAEVVRPFVPQNRYA
jgi:tetratricopeptide (TPR) repeat protein